MVQVLLTGATGFVGSEVLRHLLARGHRVRALVRPGSRRAEASDADGQAAGAAVERVAGDILDAESVRRAAQECDAVVHLVGIIRELPRRGMTFQRIHVDGTRHVVEAARSAGVRRFVHMSALGARAEATAAYHRSKFAAEELVRNSGLEYTIFRPSVIFGPRDEFINMLADLMRKAPLVPVIGDGRYRLQPVAVEDVAQGFAGALGHPRTAGETYDVGGPEAYTYLDLLRQIGETTGRRPRFVHLPLGLMRALVPYLQHLPGFPITRDQLVMLLEGNTCDSSGFYRDLAIEPTPLERGIAQYLRR